MTTEERTFTSTGLELGPPIPAGDALQMQASLEQYTSDREALAAVREQLLEQHGDIWVAVIYGRVFTAGTGPELLTLLRAEGQSTGQAVVRFLTRSPRPWIHYHA